MTSPYRFLLAFLVVPAIVSLSYAQPVPSKNPCTKVSVSWYGADDPRYGMTLLYSWSQARVRNAGGSESAVELGPRLTPDESGEFVLTSRPIAVSDSSGWITLNRVAEFHLSEAECGTWLDHDTSQAAWRQSKEGINRMMFLQAIDVIDAATGKPLIARADWKRIGVTRREQLNDMVADDEVKVDLSGFAGKYIQLRARVVTGYSGRGCNIITEPQFVTTSPDGVPCEEELVLP